MGIFDVLVKVIAPKHLGGSWGVGPSCRQCGARLGPLVGRLKVCWRCGYQEEA
jgi:hypothetical protein